MRENTALVAPDAASAEQLERLLEENHAEQLQLRREEAELRQRLRQAEESTSAPAPVPAAPAPTIDWSGAFAWDGLVRDALRTTFGFNAFRPLQREVINATLSGRDCFATLCTGSGKSLLFMLPALLKPSGLTVIVCPLVSLMQDQVSRLGALGLRAALVAADVTDRAAAAAVQNEAADPAGSGLRFLYVTPERVAKSKLLLSRLQKAYLAGGLDRIAIDEAHCCAAQGHDFRPDYLQVNRYNRPTTY